jgi:hypothetical protein
MKIKGCRPEFQFVLFVVVAFALIFGPLIYDQIEKDTNQAWGFNTDNNMGELIILSNPGNMPSSGMGMGF